MLLRASDFVPLAAPCFPKFLVFHYGGNKAKSVNLNRKLLLCLPQKQAKAQPTF